MRLSAQAAKEATIASNKLLIIIFFIRNPTSSYELRQDLGLDYLQCPVSAPQLPKTFGSVILSIIGVNIFIIRIE